MLAAAKFMQSYNIVDYPIGGTYKAGWNLGEEFVNNYLGNGGEFFGEGNAPSINNATGVATLNTMKALTEYMDPEYLVGDSTYVQQQFQQEHHQRSAWFLQLLPSLANQEQLGQWNVLQEYLRK